MTSLLSKGLDPIPKNILKKVENDACKVWSYDHTEVTSVPSFQKFIASNHLTNQFKILRINSKDDPRPNAPAPKGDKIYYYKFAWCTPNRSVCLETMNNPITGKHGNPLRADIEKKYAGSVWIRGSKSQDVYDLAMAFRKIIKHTKEEYPCKFR